MDYCAPRGIRWSVFTGWPEVDRDAALLWQLQQAETCPGCGTHADDWDPERGGHPAAFVASQRGCPGCAALERKQEQLAKKAEKSPSEYRGWRAYLKRQVERRRT